jgi:sporulation protein YlmC with PRC-barrel domain
MLYLSTKIYNLPVLSIRSGGRIGTILEPIINPHNLHIDGFYCQSSHSNKKLVLLDMHIRDFSHKGIIIDDHNSMSEPEELVRLKHVLDINFKLEDKMVFVGKRKVGKVNEYALNIDSMLVQTIYVQPPVWKNFRQNGLVFDRKSIIEVTDTHIKVSGPEVKGKTTDKVAAIKLSTNYSANSSLTSE